MSVSKQEVDSFENKFKEELFNKISEVYAKFFETINLLTQNANALGQANVDIPNTATLLNNKIVELSHTFEDSGISMFSSKSKDNDYVTSSFIGNAIIQDLIDKMNLSYDRISEYGNKMVDVSEQRNKRIQALEKTSPMRKLFSRIKSLFVKTKPIDLSLTDAEQSLLDRALQEYKDIGDQIWNYNLEENLASSLVKAISGPIKFGDFNIPHCYVPQEVPYVLDEDIVPDLEKLGLGNMIPKLKEALIEEYKKDLPDPEIYQISEEDMSLYVPDFSRKVEEKKKAPNRKLKSVEQEESLGGLSEDSFESIDLSVSADERKAATDIISKELKQEQTNDLEEINKISKTDDGVSLE